MIFEKEFEKEMNKKIGDFFTKILGVPQEDYKIAEELAAISQAHFEIIQDAAKENNLPFERMLLTYIHKSEEIMLQIYFSRAEDKTAALDRILEAKRQLLKSRYVK